MSLNMPEDDKCCYLTTHIIEPTENFEEWLDKNQVVVVTNENEEGTKEGTGRTEIGIFLNQIYTDLNHPVSENECASPKLSGSGTCDIELVDKSDLNYRIIFLEAKFLEGIQVAFFIRKLNSYIKLIDSKNNNIEFPNLSITGTKDSRKVIPNKDVILKVKSIEKIQLAENLNAIMPSLHLVTGLKLNICPRLGCDLVYTNLSKAKLHALSHIGFKPYKCSIPRCQWEFYTKIRLERHSYTHSRTKDFTCSEENCGKKFSNVSNLKIHLKKHKRPATIPCPVKTCNQLFQTSRLREMHLRTHDKSEAPYKCSEPDCNRTFFLSMSLNCHAKAHLHNESDLTCNFENCGKVFHSPCRLDEHKRIHTGLKPYACTFNTCKWSFPTSSKLKRHQATHLGEKKFHCTIGKCTKSFLRSEHLKSHTLTHIDPREFKCEYCEIKCVHKRSLQQHMKKSHPNESKEACARAVPYLQTAPTETSDILLEQAIQSLGVHTDTVLGTGLISDESIELLDSKNFSTVNLRDLD